MIGPWYNSFDLATKHIAKSGFEEVMKMDANILPAKSREEFREWLTANATSSSECWVRVKNAANPFMKTCSITSMQ